MARYHFIDAIRGAAACSVMVQHSLYESGILGAWQPGRQLTGFIPNFLELGETGVVAFFLVSGFVIPLSLEKTADFRLFWIHRAFRIYPLYLVVFVVFFLITGGGNIHSLMAFVADAFSHMLFIQEYLKQENFVPGAWTLSLEMLWYIAISLAFLLALNRRTGWLVAFGAALSITAQAACVAGHHVPMGRLSLLICCLFGLVCYRYGHKELSQRRFLILSSILAITIASNLFTGFYLFPGPHPTAQFPMVFDSWALAGLIFVVPFLTREAAIWEHPLPNYLGKISYSTYLLHGVVLALLVRISLSGITLIVATVLFTIFVSAFTYHFIEAPWIRFSHNIKFPSAPILPSNSGSRSAEAKLEH